MQFFGIAQEYADELAAHQVGRRFRCSDRIRSDDRTLLVCGTSNPEMVSL